MLKIKGTFCKRPNVGVCGPGKGDVGELNSSTPPIGLI